MVGKAQGFSARDGLRRLVERWQLVGWWQRRGILSRDGALALALAAVAFMPGLVDNGLRIGELPQRQLDVWGVLLGVGQSLPLVARRRWPVVCLALASGAFCADQLLAYPSSFASEGTLLALYAGGAYIERHRRVVAGVASAGYVALALALHQLGSLEQRMDYVAFWLVLAGCWAAGCWMRKRRSQEEERQLHSAQLAVSEERSRIARELHDVVTHHVTAIVVQADAAQFVLPTAPERVADSLTAMGSTGRRALADLRYLLDVLDGRPEEAADPQHGPLPGRLTDLVETTRSAGQPVELVERGEQRPIPDSMALAAYRLVQEALTNAVKYAPGRPTMVELAYDDKGIDIHVTNEGPGPDPVSVTMAVGTSAADTSAADARAVGASGIPSGGRGLAGLRKRIGAFGGDLSAGPRQDGGFQVSTRLPLASDR